MADDIMMTQPGSSLGTSSGSSRFEDAEDSLSSEHEVLLNVLTTTGHEQHIRVSKDITVRKLKQLCIPKYIEEKRLSEFESSGGVPGACGGVAVAVSVGSPSVSDEDDEARFKLVHAKTGRCLADSQSLSDQSIAHSDSLLLLPRKTKPPQFSTLKAIDGSTRPSALTIDELTSSLPTKNHSRNPKKDSNFNNYLTEMRKIMLSLIYVSHRLLCHNKEAVDMFREAIVLLKASRASDERHVMDLTEASIYSLRRTVSDSSSAYAPYNSPISTTTTTAHTGKGAGASSWKGSGTRATTVADIKVDCSLIKQLTDMGFNSSLAKLALILNDMSLSLATEWLLAHSGEDTEATASILASQLNHQLAAQQAAANQRQASSSISEEPMDITEDCEGEMDGTEKREHTAEEGLKVLQQFHELSFQPDPKALKSLLDMGFPRQDSYDALRINGNHENFACEWLLNYPRRPSIEDWEKGIDPNSSMYKAIVSNPLVQLLLNSPKTLLALEDILGHPNSMSHYLNDPDAGPLLVQISSIYSTERYSDSNSGGSSSGSSISTGQDQGQGQGSFWHSEEATRSSLI